MNFGNMRANTRMILGEPTATNSAWGDPEIDRVLNDVSVNISAEIEPLLTSATFSTVASQQDYSLPSNYLKAVKLEIELATNNWKQLEYFNIHEFSLQVYRSPFTEGNPRIYKIEIGAVEVSNAIPGHIFLYPVPSSVLTARFHYIKKPDLLSSDAEISELPEYMHWAVCLYTASLLALKTRDQVFHDRIIGLYRLEIDKIRGFEVAEQDIRAEEIRDDLYLEYLD